MRWSTRGGGGEADDRATEVGPAATRCVGGAPTCSQGNWIEVDASSPYVLIGESSYGKPLLDRYWNCERSLAEAHRISLLAFDATHASTTSVGLPLDAVVYASGSFEMSERRFTQDELAPLAEHWRRVVIEAAESTAPIIDPLIQELVPVASPR